MVLFFASQIAPAERLVLLVLLAEGDGRQRFTHFKAEIKRVADIDLAGPLGEQYLKKLEGVAVVQMHTGRNEMDLIGTRE